MALQQTETTANVERSFSALGSFFNFDILKSWDRNSGSSRKGSFYCAPAALVKAFGPPNETLYTFDGKVDAGYVLRLYDIGDVIPSDHKTVEIYCYKATDAYEPGLPSSAVFWDSETIECFSISAKTAIAGEIFQSILNSLLMPTFFGLISKEGRREAVERINMFRRFDKEFDNLLAAQETKEDFNLKDLEDLAPDEGDDYPEDMDGDHQSGLASAGFGTDEDYGSFGGSDDA